MKETVRIVGAVVDTRLATFYKEDGSTIIIHQGDARLREILEVVTPKLALNLVAEIEIDGPAEVPNHYKEFEQKSSGIVKFFRVAKAAVAKFFGNADPVAPVNVGRQPKLTDEAKEQKLYEQITQQTEVKTMTSAVNEILANAVSASHPSFTEENIEKQDSISGEIKGNKEESIEDTHTMVATVDGKIIPGVELIKTQIGRAAQTTSIGVENFMKRMATIVDQRSHSVKDLLKFMERGDLPIADDGCIVIYKILRKSNGHYVDCHSGKVPQMIGSYVCMDTSLVDHNRNNECSNGLHVARRQYINNFGGDVCVIAKVAPEDVITVPTYDANKMRVCGYHILHELTGEQYQKLKRNVNITDDAEGKKLLGRILAGQHVGRLQEVRITKPMGGGIVITELVDKPVDNVPTLTDVVPETEPDTPVDNSEGDGEYPGDENDMDPDDPDGDLAQEDVPPQAPVERLAEALEDAPNPDKPDLTAEPVNPKELAQKVIGLSKREQALEMLSKIEQLSDGHERKTLAQELLAFKKKAKKGWETFDIDSIDVKLIEKAAAWE